MDWTEEQKRILDIENSNILVSAAAGSGKTAIMVERIINKVKYKKVDIDRFLVVTFTNAAAAGMKQRIQKALLEDIDRGKVHLKRQLNLINRAQISTIHSFCLKVIEENYHLVGLDSNMSQGDTNELRYLLQESIDEVLERKYKDKSEDFIKLIEGFTGDRGDLELNSMVHQAYRFLLSLPNPINWLNESIREANSIENLKGAPWFKEIESYLRLQLEGGEDLVDLAVSCCRKEVLLKDKATFSNLSKDLDDGLDKFLKGIKGVKFARLTGVKDKEVKAEVDNIRNIYKRIIKDIEDIFPYGNEEEYLKDMAYIQGAIEELGDIVKKVDSTYKEKKMAKGIIDFNDMEHYALEILKNEDVAAYYRNKFKFIFIDEYQDSNSLQETIISRIKNEDNLFMVGDVKQSIYRFRKADPDIFMEKYAQYPKDNDGLEESETNRLVELNKNFRSRKEILACINHIFERIMSKEIGEIIYDDSVKLSCGSNGFTIPAKVELNIIDKSKGQMAADEDGEDMNQQEKKNDSAYIQGLKDAEIEALYAANKVKDLLGERIDHVSAEDGTRNIQYGDIVILLRSVRNWANVFEDVFNRKGIPFYFDGGEGFFDIIEIQVLINILRVLDNQNQDIPLISIMRSSIGGFTTGELTEIRSKTVNGGFLKACYRYISANRDEDEEESVRNEELSEEIKGKLERFFGMIKEWRFKSRLVSIDDLIWAILMDSGFYNFVGALPNGQARQGNLRILVDKAYDFQKRSTGGLFDFISYIERIGYEEQDDTSTAKALGENDNVVRLMTVHKSKGLEFPVVILCGLSKRINLRDTNDKILLHKDLGIAAAYVDMKTRGRKDTLPRVAISKKIIRENLSEEMRILYVAMTRAIDRLIMVGTLASRTKEEVKWKRGHTTYLVYLGKSYLDWIGASLCEETLDFIEINDVDMNNIDEETQKIHRENFIEEMDQMQGCMDKDKYREIKRRLGFEYPYGESISIPTKLAVTDLNRLYTDKDMDYKGLRYNITGLSKLPKYNKRDKRFELEESFYEGSRIGTLIHLVMEHMDIRGDLSKTGIENQIEELFNRNLIGEKDKNYIKKFYIDKIRNFFNSHIGKRLIASPLVKKEVPFVLRKKAKELIGDTSDDYILIQGIIDCYFEEEDKIVIIDYKTDSSKEDNIDVIREEYKKQIETYKEALEKITGKEVKESYLYLFSSESFL